MGNYAQLKDSVLAQAHEKGRALLEAAIQQAQEERAVASQQLLQEKKERRQKALKALDSRLQRERQQIANKKRQSSLASKQALLTQLYEEVYDRMASWTREEELDFLTSVLRRYDQEELLLTFGATTADKLDEADQEQLLAAFPRLTLATETIRQQAGFVLSRGRIDDNYLYRELIQSIWESQGHELAREIFRDEET